MCDVHTRTCLRTCPPPRQFQNAVPELYTCLYMYREWGEALAHIRGLECFTTPRNPSGMVWAAQLPPGARRLGWQVGHYLVGLRAVQLWNRVSRPVVEYKHSMSIAYGGCL
jgi:hypothetical protein